MTTFALLDINNFYASAETLFNPAFKHQKLVCLSNNDGCAISRNPLAKAAGIKMGEPWFQIQQRFKPGEVMAMSSHFAVYAELSDRMVQIVSRFTPKFEVYSVDECILDLAGFEHLDLTGYGQELRATMQKWLGLPVCVGIGDTKTLCKLSNYCAKKQSVFNGVCNFKAMDNAQRDTLIKSIPVGEVWGVGSRLTTRLNRIGVFTAYDLKTAHRRTLRDIFSVMMEKTIAELNGIPCIELEDLPPPKQNIASTRSFGKPVSDLASLKEAVTLYTSIAAEKARLQGSYANSISVFIQTSPFNRLPYYANCQTAALPSPCNDSRILVKTALWLLKRLYKAGYQYQKAGVLLNDLVPSAGVQQDLFFIQDSLKAEKIMSVMDTVNNRYGRQTLHLASMGFKSPWRMKQERKSPGYTYDWDDLIKAN